MILSQVFTSQYIIVITRNIRFPVFHQSAIPGSSLRLRVGLTLGR